VTNNQDPLTIPPKRQIGKKSAHPVYCLTPTLTAGVGHVEVLAPIAMNLRSGNTVHLSVIALPESPIRENRYARACKGYLHRLNRSPEVRHVDGGQPVVATALAERRCVVPPSAGEATRKPSCRYSMLVVLSGRVGFVDNLNSHDADIAHKIESAPIRREREQAARRHTWTMRVRPAVDSDCPAITSAYIAAWRAGYRDLLNQADLEVQAESRSGRDWASAIGHADRIVLVAEDGSGEIVGVAECEHDPADGRLPWLQMLYVVPSAWGTGAAAELLHEALDAAHRVGHRTVWLEVVDRQLRARRFYEREGFVLDRAMAPGSNGLFDLLCYRHEQPAP
jgi:GNAT superfamily N-acetyltransferase